MKGSREHKHYVAKYRKELHKMCWDDLHLMRLEMCKKKFVRIKKPTEYDLLD